MSAKQFNRSSYITFCYFEFERSASSWNLIYFLCMLSCHYKSYCQLYIQSITQNDRRLVYYSKAFPSTEPLTPSPTCITDANRLRDSASLVGGQARIVPSILRDSSSDHQHARLRDTHSESTARVILS